MATEIANVEMAEAWDGAEGEGWTKYDDHYSNSLRPHTDRLFEAAGIGAGERVLDIGCRCGATTRRAAEVASSGSALGVDLSSKMLARARSLADEAGIANITFEQADAQVHPFEPRDFDVAISKNGCMFFGDPVAAFKNIGSALKPDGRIVLLVWQEPWKSENFTEIGAALAMGRELPRPPTDKPGPFALSVPERTRGILTDAGFDQIEFSDVALPMQLGVDPDDAYEFATGMGVVRGLLQDLSPADQQIALSRLKTMIEDRATSEGVYFATYFWLIKGRLAKA